MSTHHDPWSNFPGQFCLNYGGTVRILSHHFSSNRNYGCKTLRNFDESTLIGLHRASKPLFQSPLSDKKEHFVSGPLAQEAENGC